MYVKKVRHQNNRIFDILLICLGSLSIIYFFITMTVGFSNFLISFFITGVLALVYGIYELKTHISIFHLFPKFIRQTTLCIITLALLFFSVVETFIIYYGQKQDMQYSDTVIILGAGVNGDEVSKTLKYRLDAALLFYEQHPEATFIVSGGQGFRETRSEASAMSEYLIQHGIPEENILLEDTSSNTSENFRFSKEILEKAGNQHQKLRLSPIIFICFVPAILPINKVLLLMHMPLILLLL